MARIVVASGYSLYGQSGGYMTSPDFTGWQDASNLTDGSVLLRPSSLTGLSLTNITLTGPDISIEPNALPAPSLTIADRLVFGTVEGFSYLAGTGASHGSVSVQYEITGLSISFEDLLAAGDNPLVVLLSGNDVIEGTNSYDTLYGYAGDDTFLPGFSGKYPSNTLYDQIDGGAGNDTIVYENIPTFGVFIDLAAGTARIGDADAPTSARMVSIENAVGTFQNDTINGNSVSNDIYGGGGADSLYGLDGHDRLFGGDGNDRLFGGNGGDVLNGGIGNDTLCGDAGADQLNGFEGVDIANYASSTVGMTINLTSGTASDGDTLTLVENIVGTLYDDVVIGHNEENALFGGSGSDQIFGLVGNDRLEGQIGDDALFGGDGDDIQGGGDGNDGVFGEAGADSLYGGDGNDYLSGGDGNDVLWGDEGNDQIDAGAGNDFIVLGSGNDGFVLGAGDDIIRVDSGNGNDTIFDFGNGNDVIYFSAPEVTRASLQANAYDTSEGMLLTLGQGSILLAGISSAQVDWNQDFVFAA
jgi:Ca2+-binding RTX toxin-like protein